MTQRQPLMTYVSTEVKTTVRKKRDQAKSAALNRLKDTFPTEYLALYHQELRRRGIAEDQVAPFKKSLKELRASGRNTR